MSFHCAVDFGGSSTKWSFREEDGPYVQGRLTDDDHRHIWSNPQEIGERLVELFVNQGARRIVSLGISMSGNVRDHIVTASDRLNEIVEAAGNTFPEGGLDLRAQLQPRLSQDPPAQIAVVNDGVASALGVRLWCSMHAREAMREPILVLALGSYPAISIVEGTEGAIQIHSPATTAFSMATIATSTGEAIALHAPGGLRGADLEGMERTRKSARIGRAVASVLGMYWERFQQYQPLGGIFVMGGHGFGLDDAVLQDSLRERLAPEITAFWEANNVGGFGHTAPLPYIRAWGSYEDQSAVHLNGAAGYPARAATTIIR